MARSCSLASTDVAPPLAGFVTWSPPTRPRSAAALTLTAERMQADIINGLPIDADAMIRVTSTAKRILGAISAKAAKNKPAGPDLASYLAATYPKPAAEPADDEPDALDQ